MVTVAAPLGLSFLGDFLFLCSSVGLLENALIAANLPLQVLLDVSHPLLIVHLCDDGCVTWHALQLTLQRSLHRSRRHAGSLLRSWNRWPPRIVRAAAIALVLVLGQRGRTGVDLVLRMLESTHWLVVRVLRSGKHPAVLNVRIIITFVVVHLLGHLIVALLAKDGGCEHLVTKLGGGQTVSLSIRNHVAHRFLQGVSQVPHLAVEVCCCALVSTCGSLLCISFVMHIFLKLGVFFYCLGNSLFLVVHLREAIA